MRAARRFPRVARLLLALALVLIALLLPRLTSSGYALNAMIATVRWMIFALSFDLVAGHAGAVSLGHPVFFGAGAYVAAILGPKLGLGFVADMLLAAVLMALLALVAGFAFFRIRGVTFAIGTLGAAIIAQLVVNNAFNITRGPMCIQGVARPELAIPFTTITLRITDPLQYYYLSLPLLLITVIVYLALTRSRLGRAFTAVREDEVRAQAVGVYPLRYKMLAFVVGAALVGALGSYQAHYVTVVCPSEMSLGLTTTLLIIVFVGGVGSFRGVMLGALIFSVLPRLLEAGGTRAISPAYQQIVYGIILVAVMVFMPGGLDDLIARTTRRLRGKGRIEESS
ncbi:MAG TPA: branched-chain amino acid ABC transporter permease [Candidatus Binatia bacterium]|nr:branched-chain amino acid ABC transporter permease [Candidatus Binatia bacterium]